MSQLQEQINNDLIQAMKAKDQETTSALRMLNSELKNKKIEKQEELTDEDVTQIIKKVTKQRKDSIASYKDGGRDDLAEKEQKELEMLAKYLPEEMPEEEVEKIVQEVVAETGASSMQDMGKVMGAAMGKLQGKADGNVVKNIAQKLLS